MELNVILKASELYGVSVRRNREMYLNHCLRVVQLLDSHGYPLEYQEVGLLHDVLEMNSKVSLLEVASSFNLTEDQIIALGFLTRKNGETSKEHFNRVLNSGHMLTLVVKACDLLDNADFKSEDYVFTREVLGEDPETERNKYIIRFEEIRNAITDIGFEF